MASILASIFSPEAPEAKLKRWKTATRTQTRSIDSQIRTLGVQKQKAAVQIRAYLRNKDTQNARLLASALIKLNRTLERLHTTKAHLNSVQMQIDHQIASVKVMGAFALGAEVMHKWNVGGVGEVGRVMREVGVEMMKNGLIQEMVEDAMDLNDDADVEEADEEVDKIMQEITTGKLDAIKPTNLNNLTGESTSAVIEAGEDRKVRERMEALNSI